MPVKLQAAPTFRDLGGVTARDGRKVRAGRIFRAGHLLPPASAEAETIRRLGLRRVFDLRSAAERARQPSTWADFSGARTVECDVNTDVRSGHAGLLHLLKEDLGEAGAHEMMLHTYRNFTFGFSNQLRALFDALLDEEGLPMLVHCTAGKDRTGFACAMVLHALDVDEEQIFADYLATGDVLVGGPIAASMQQFLASLLGRAPTPPAIDLIMSVRREFLETAFAAVRGEYGSIENFLEQAGGMDVQRCEALRQCLLE
jgi:protein-tyrosine phosphatase